MTVFSAWVNWDGRPAEPAVLAAANACMGHRCPDGAWTWHDGAVGLAQADLATLPEDRPGELLSRGPLRIAASCRVDNRDELRAALPDAGLSAADPDAAYILAAYAAWGDACVDRLVGDYAFAIWDERRRRLFVGRDLSGARRVFYFRDRSRLIVASDRTQILQDPTVPFEIDDEQVLEYITPAYQWTSGWEQPFFRGFSVLPAGHTLAAEDGRVTVRRFWDWREGPPWLAPEREVLDQYLHTLDLAVRSRLRSRVPQLAIELSGGLDSTAIACLAARSPEGQALALHTLSIFLDYEPEERDRIEQVLSLHPFHAHRFDAANLYWPYYLTADWAPRVIDGIHDITHAPSRARFFETTEASGSRVLVTGLMGETVNGGCDRVHYSLLRGGRLGELARRILLELRRAPKLVGPRLALYGLLPFAPMGLLRAVELVQELRAGMPFPLPDYVSGALRPALAERDRAIRMRRMFRLNARCPAVRFELEDVEAPVISCTRPPNVPVELRHPYYDRRLVELTLAMPQDLKWDHRFPGYSKANRWHHRRALAGVVPPAVLSQRSGVDFTAAIDACYSAQRVRQWLRDAPAVHIFERGYVEPASFLDAIDRPGEDHFYTHGLLRVEAWLRGLAPGGVMRRLAPPRGPAALTSPARPLRHHVSPQLV